MGDVPQEVSPNGVDPGHLSVVPVSHAGDRTGQFVVDLTVTSRSARASMSMSTRRSLCGTARAASAMTGASGCWSWCPLAQASDPAHRQRQQTESLEHGRSSDQSATEAPQLFAYRPLSVACRVSTRMGCSLPPARLILRFIRGADSLCSKPPKPQRGRQTVMRCWAPPNGIPSPNWPPKE